MHNAAYKALGLDRAYLPFHVRPDELRNALKAIPALGLLGVNLTLPHKERAFKMLASVSAEGRRLGAINCVVNRHGRLFGHNTDARGLEADLRSLKLAIARKRAVVIGAGGAAAAGVVALTRMGVEEIVLANRTHARALSLARWLRPIKIRATGLESLTDLETLGDAGIVLNASSAGLNDSAFPALRYEAASKDCFFYDLIYGRDPTPFLKPAIQLKRPTADGRGMLLHQGALAFELFNGLEAPLDAMRRALSRSLRLA